MSEPLPLDGKWLELATRLSATVDLEASARQCGALKRRRNVRDAESLLRVLMANAAGHRSLRDTAAWATLQGIKVSNPAVLKLLKRSADWLSFLVAKVLAQRVPASVQAGAGYRLRLIDATTLS